MAEKSGSEYESDGLEMEEGAASLWNLASSPNDADGEDETGKYPMPGGSEVRSEETMKGGFENLSIKKIVEEKSEKGVVLKEFVMEESEVEDGEITSMGTDEMAGNMQMEPRRLFEAEHKEKRTPEDKGNRFVVMTPKRKSSTTALLKNLYSRIVALENTQDTIAKNVERLGLNMRDLEGKYGGEKPNGIPEGDRTRAISRDQMIAYVVEAIASAQTEIGCSKAYIKKFLFDRYEIPLTPHYVKKTNAALQMGCAEKKFQFDAKYGLFRL